MSGQNSKTWFRVDNNIVDNLKLRGLAKSTQLGYFLLLSLNSSNKLVHNSCTNIAFLLHFSVRETKKLLNDLVSAGLLQTDYTPTSSGRSGSSTERVKRHRKRKNGTQMERQMEQNGTVNGTKCNGKSVPFAVPSALSEEAQVVTDIAAENDPPSPRVRKTRVDPLPDLKRESDPKKGKKEEEKKEEYRLSSGRINSALLLPLVMETQVKPKSAPYKAILDYLNKKAETNFHETTASHQKLIKARWKEGYRLPDFLKVIDNMVSIWINDDKMSRLLRPSTLFTQLHFDEYLNGRQGPKDDTWVPPEKRGLPDL